MADSDPPELAAALLKWVSTWTWSGQHRTEYVLRTRQVQAFHTSKRVEGWEDIQDGRVLWDMLRDIDPGYFDDDLPEPPSKTEDHWIPRWQNRMLDSTRNRDGCSHDGSQTHQPPCHGVPARLERLHREPRRQPRPRPQGHRHRCQPARHRHGTPPTVLYHKTSPN